MCTFFPKKRGKYNNQSGSLHLILGLKYFFMKLFVAGLPYDFDDIDLKEMFELYGEVYSAKVARDRETKKSRGFGFLDMPNDTEAKEAIQTLDGADFGRGKKLSVKKADDDPSRSGPPGRDRDNRGRDNFRDRDRRRF
jgi:cold-inducible RNA-binding protein